MSAVVTLNPATGETLAEYPAFSDDEIDAALAGADDAQQEWAARPIAERAGVLRRVAAILRVEVDALALLITARWASRWSRRAPRWRSARPPATTTPTTPRPSSPTSRSRPRPTAAGSPTTRS